MGMSYLHEEFKKIEREEGADAAREAGHGVVGGSWGMVGGAAAGATAGTAVLPGPGTVLGAIVGGFLGGLNGAKDRSAADNARTGANALRRTSRWWS